MSKYPPRKPRRPRRRDDQVSILEIAGSSSQDEDILEMEGETVELSIIIRRKILNLSFQSLVPREIFPQALEERRKHIAP